MLQLSLKIDCAANFYHNEATERNRATNLCVDIYEWRMVRARTAAAPWGGIIRAQHVRSRV